MKNICSTKVQIEFNIIELGDIKYVYMYFYKSVHIMLLLNSLIIWYVFFQYNDIILFFIST